MSKKDQKYRLFAMNYSVENVDFASSFRFARVTPEYILVYVQKKRINPPHGKAIEVKEDVISLLKDLDVAWLFDCGTSIFADIATEHKKENVDRLTYMVNRLGEELEIESRREVE